MRCPIRNDVLFAGIPAESLKQLVNPIDMLHYVEGDTIYREGEREPCLYTVRDGRVRVLHEREDGNTRILRLLGRGDALGLERLLDLPYAHTAVVLGHADLCRIPLDVMQKLEQQHPHLHYQVEQRWNQHLQQADAAINDLGTGTVRSRVVALLFRLTSESSGGFRQVELLRREDMAAMLGVRVESVSRTIADLKRRSLLQPLGREHYRYDAAALQRYAEE